MVPLWFVHRRGSFFLTQRSESPLVRAVAVHPDVVMLFDPERSTGEREVLRVRGRAEVRRGRWPLAGIVVRHSVRYHFHPRALAGYLRHPERIVDILRYYTERSRMSAVVEVRMEQAQFIVAPGPSS